MSPRRHAVRIVSVSVIKHARLWTRAMASLDAAKASLRMVQNNANYDIIKWLFPLKKGYGNAGLSQNAEQHSLDLPDLLRCT